MARRTGSSNIQRGEDRHIENYNNPHRVTIDQIGGLTRDEIQELTVNIESGIRTTVNRTINQLETKLDDQGTALNQAIIDGFTDAGFYYNSQINEVTDALNNSIVNGGSEFSFNDVAMSEGNGILVTGWNRETPGSEYQIARINIRGDGVTSSGESFAGIHIQKNEAVDPVNDPVDWQTNFWANPDGDLFMNGNLQLADGSVLIGTREDFEQGNAGVFIDQNLGVVVQGDTNLSEAARVVLSGQGVDGDAVPYSGISIQGWDDANSKWVSNFYADSKGDLYLRNALYSSGILTGNLSLTGLLSIGDPTSIFVGPDITTYTETSVQTYSDTLLNDSDWTTGVVNAKTFTVTDFDIEKYTRLSLDYTATGTSGGAEIRVQGYTGADWATITGFDITNTTSSIDSVINTIGYTQVRIFALHDGTLSVSNITARQYDPIMYISNGKIMQKISPNVVIPLGNSSGNVINTGGGSSTKWIEITGKPFTNIGTGLSVDGSDNLNVTLAPFTTTDLSEGTNLYHTTQRVQDVVSGANTFQTLAEEDAVNFQSVTINGNFSAHAGNLGVGLDFNVTSAGDFSVSNVPNSSLQNSSITITTGTGLTGGGVVSLGGTVVLQADSTDFVNTSGDTMTGGLTIDPNANVFEPLRVFRGAGINKRGIELTATDVNNGSQGIIRFINDNGASGAQMDFTNTNINVSIGTLSVGGTQVITSESDPIFSASEASNITVTDTDNWDTAYIQRASQVAGTGLTWDGLDLNVSSVPNTSLQNSSITILGGTGITVSNNPVPLGGSTTITANSTDFVNTSGDTMTGALTIDPNANVFEPLRVYRGASTAKHGIELTAFDVNNGSKGTIRYVAENGTPGAQLDFTATTANLSNGLLSVGGNTVWHAGNSDDFDNAGTYANLRAQATTKADVGLGNVNNYGITDAYSLNSSTTYASAKAVHDHDALTNNPHNVTVSQIGAVPDFRTITINGNSQSLAANRIYNVGTITSVTAGTGLSGGGTAGGVTLNVDNPFDPNGDYLGLRARATTASDVGVDKAYIDSLGVDADTLDGWTSGSFMFSERGGNITSNTVLDDSSKPNGAYRVDSGLSSSPDSGRFYSLLVYGNENNVVGQLATDFQTGETHIRAYNTSWSSWRTLWDTSNLTNVSQLTNDAGYYSSGDNVSFGTGDFSGGVNAGADGFSTGLSRFQRIEALPSNDNNVYVGWINSGVSGLAGTLGLIARSSVGADIRLFTGSPTPTLRATIDSNGNFGIGTASPSYKLDVSGTGRFTGALTLPVGVWHLDSNGDERIHYGSGTHTYIRSAGTGSIFFRNGSNATIAEITSSGISKASDHQDPSDRRIKTVIDSNVDPLSFAKEAHLHYYDKRGLKQFGLFAQDLMKADERVVGSMNDEEFGEIYTLSGYSVASIALAGVGKVDSKVERLEKRVNELEEQVRQLGGMI